MSKQKPAIVAAFRKFHAHAAKSNAQIQARMAELRDVNPLSIDTQHARQMEHVAVLLAEVAAFMEGL